MRQVEVTDLFIGSDIQRADDDFTAFHVGERLFVGFKLILFARIVVAVEVEEFTAEKSDAACIVLEYSGNIIRRTDVAVNADLVPVFGLVRQPLELVEQFLLFFLFFHLLQQAGFGDIIGFDDDVAGVAVQDHFAAFIFRLHLVADADNGGNAHGAGQDGGVAGAGTAFRDETEDLALVQLDGFARSQVIRGQDHGNG